MNNEDLIASAHKLGLMDRTSKEPVVRRMLVLADALKQSDRKLEKIAQYLWDCDLYGDEPEVDYIFKILGVDR